MFWDEIYGWLRGFWLSPEQHLDLCAVGHNGVHVQVPHLRSQGDCAMARTVGADRTRRGVKRGTEVVSAATAVDDAQTTHARGQTHEAHGGDFATTASWTVSGATGYYAPVLITPSGQVFVVGDANPGGHDQIRVYGENTFGFEDLAYNQGSDFDYNDMVMRLKPTPDHPFS
jgi:Domain of unknown function (DUF4114)